jgi:tetratricopeptide (TPR) repeat protein
MICKLGVLSILSFLLSCLPAVTQETHWKELKERAHTLDQQGLYAEGLPVAEESVRIARSTFGHWDLRLAESLNELGEFYLAQGPYAKAEPLFTEAISIRKKRLGPKSPDLAQSLNDLGVLYSKLGRYSDALRPIKQALAIRQESLGSDSPFVALSLNDLAGVYVQFDGQIAEARRLLERAWWIWQKTGLSNQPDATRTLNNLAELYKGEDSQDNKKAETLFKRALAGRQKALGPEHPDVALSLCSLAELYQHEGRYAEAEPLYKQAVTISQNALGPAHPNTAYESQKLGSMYYVWDRPKDAQKYFDMALQDIALQLRQEFPYMNEQQQLGFLATVSDIFPVYVSFAATYKDQIPDVAGQLYDLLSWEKGLIAYSVATQRVRMVATGDTEVLKLFDQLAAKRNQYAGLISTETRDRSQWRKKLDELQKEANDLDEQLVRRSAVFLESEQLVSPSWREVQKSLGKDEAAVEFVRFTYTDGKNAAYSDNYAALVLTAASKNGPVMIDLENDWMLESVLREAYYERVSSPSQPFFDPASETAFPPPKRGPLAFYNHFWKPIEEALHGAKRIYVSTDGALNQVALGLMPMPDGHLLMENHDVRLVNRTADLLQRIVVGHSNQTAVLFANPYFNILEADYRKALAELAFGERISRTGSVPALGQSGATLGKLLDQASTHALETGLQNDVIPLLKQHGWTVESYFEYSALVEAVEQVRAPRLLHIATHGDFLPDPPEDEELTPEQSSNLPLTSNPMLRSRLFFAGANQTLAGHPLPADLSDGIFTAYQASTLNLHGTELVVLSACETGRGHEQDGEGVFGLRRAFQEAGAESVLMTLWEVPATETQELLNNFYHYWLDGGGEEQPNPSCPRRASQTEPMDKHQALLVAQQDERVCVQKRYGSDLPYYWGGFVLVGR